MRHANPLLRTLLLSLPLALAAVSGFGLDDGGPWSAARVETAYRLATSGAAGDGERVEAARMRCQALDMLVQVSYQATLAWFAEKGDLPSLVSGDQKLWQRAYRLWLRRAERRGVAAAAVEAYDMAAEMALARLAAFRLVTSGGGFGREAR